MEFLIEYCDLFNIFLEIVVMIRVLVNIWYKHLKLVFFMRHSDEQNELVEIRVA